jgi:hypothetical protein
VRASDFAIGFVLLGILVPCPTSGACINYSDYIHWTGDVALPDRPLDVAVSGAHAYVAAQDSGIVVIDISDARSPRIVGKAITPAAALDVAVIDGHAYVAAGDSGLVVIDVANPASPLIVGRIRTPYPAVQVAAAGQYVYLGELKEAQGVVQVIDITNPAGPEVRGQVVVEGMTDVTASGTRVYVVGIGSFIYGSWSSFQTIDASNPRNPRITGGLGLPYNPWAMYLGGLAVSGSHAYVADGYEGVQVIDIAQKPRIVGSVSTGGCYYNVAVSGALAYAVKSGFNGGELQAIDVSIPGSPRVLATTGTPTWPNEVALPENGGWSHVFVVDGSDGPHASLHVFDFTGLRTPSIVGSYDAGEMCFRLDVQDNIAYLAAYYTGIRLIDVSDPRSPWLRGIVDTPDMAVAVAVSGAYAYVADGWAGLQVIHSGAYVVGGVGMPGFAADVALSGNSAYVVTEGSPSRLQVVDIADPGAPGLLGSVELPGVANGVAVSGARAYVANADGLIIVDIADPANPRIMGSVDIPGRSSGVVVLGTLVYVAAAESGLQVVDVADPGNPRIVNTVDTLGQLSSVSISGKYLYAADWLDGLIVFDIADPRNPRTLGGLGNNHEALDVVVSGGYAVIGVGNIGLEIMPVQCTPEIGSGSRADIEPMDVPDIVPNPAVGPLTIHLSQAARTVASVVIYDAAGRQVRRLHDGVLDAGQHQLFWDGRDDMDRQIAAGIYWARVSTSEGMKTARIVMLK